MISVRTRRAEPGSPLRARVTGTIGAGVPESRGSFEVSKGSRARRRARPGARAECRGLRQPGRGSVQLRVGRIRGFSCTSPMPSARGSCRRHGRATTAATSSGRATIRGRSASTIRSRTHTASLRPTKSPDVAGFRQMAFTGFLGAYEQRTDQDRFATADHRTQHRARRRLRQRLPRQGQRRRGSWDRHGLNSAST